MGGWKRSAILVGDIGGTNTRLAIIEMVKGHFNFLAEETFPSREEPSLESALRKFLSNHLHPIAQVCLGVAGPVRGGRSEATNLPWVIDSKEIARQLNVPRVGLINDWEAGAYGIAALKTKDFEVLNQGTHDAQGNRAIISAGTGLGQVGLFWDDREYKPFASEGGHADFAPRNQLEMDLLDYLLKRYSRVSAERVISGQGLLNIYRWKNWRSVMNSIRCYGLSGFMFLTVLIVVCGGTKTPVIHSQQNVHKTSVDSIDMLVGKITKEDLYREFPVFKETAEGYSPQPEIVEKIRKLNQPTSVILFLGTWCKDSISEAPKFLKTYDLAANPNFSLEIYALNRKKEDGLGMAERFRLERVPTMIFLRDGKEISRIVEYPNKSMEEDFLRIAELTEPEAPQSPAPPKPEKAAKAPRMTVEELKKMMDEGATVVIVDTNDQMNYKMKHIKGAVHFPWAKVIGEPGPLPKDKLLVLYCGCIGEEASDDVAQQLMNDWGYKNVKVLDGGLMLWIKLGYPVETG
jgi:rhodanese-related sulfurtransferase/thiol-disulfide isomerase/thioredoxin